MASRTHLALGFAAVTALILALGAVALVLLAGANHDPVERLVVAALLATCLAGIGCLAVAALPAAGDRREPTAARDTTPTVMPSTPSPPLIGRNPFADRRGPNRAANVVRPAFGQPASDGATMPSRAAEPPDDWEAF